MENKPITKNMREQRYSYWITLMLSLLIALSLGTHSGQAASNTGFDQPILTKSGKKAALMEAAAAIQAKPSNTNAKPPYSSPSLLALPGSATDETVVPHYFGPYPNWANSPFTLPDAAVTINGNGLGAEAVATVDGNGAITGITVTNPGSGYTVATISITGSGTGAAATAVGNLSGGSVTAVNVTSPGGGYTSPTVAFTGGTAGTPAVAIAYGGVDAVNLTNAGSGYSNPTVDFDLPDGPDGVKAVAHATWDTNGVITGIVVDQPGSGYSFAPVVVIRDGTLFDPIPPPNGFIAATATTTLAVQTVEVTTVGDGYTSEPVVAINDATGAGTGAFASATTNTGAITSITLTSPGSGYITPGIKKFQDGLPNLCDPSVAGSCDAAANNLGQYIPRAVPDTTTFSGDSTRPDADYYVIALVQHREQMNSSLPTKGTLLREYVQLETPANASWSKHVALQTQLLDGTTTPVLMPDGTQAYGVDEPHFLGPLIVAQKDRPVRITFYNLLPSGSDGDLYLPTDSTIMGAGYAPPLDNSLLPEPLDQGTVMDEVRNPVCSQFPKDPLCFKDNRATLHFHGGITPWISDGTPHQWITPANEATDWPQGVSVGYVPDMVSVPGHPEVANCSGETDGCQTFYYTNQQSARLMFYHDHAWGTTRLNVLLGEAAGYLITDPTDQQLIADGIVPTDEIPLIIQDRTFVPSAAQMAWQDPTWDSARWGDLGNFWYHHVYMPAQNPGDPSGMSAFGRWMYGPWFWPPATPPYGPIANPYYTGTCNFADSTTWDVPTDPFCEPQMIPGTPTISVGMEQFNDTPMVNGTAYPTTTVEPKAYRFRILNAANDRFFNLQWYIGDPNTASTSLNQMGEPIGPTEVAFNPDELAAAQIDPNIFPTPDTTVSPAGPSWIQIGNEGGFLPAPVVVPNQPTTWIIDPTRFDVGNVDLHSMLIAPAERVDVIVDFSQYAGQTLILYNDAPAAFPARVASYDYYTGAPDLAPVGAPTILPGYGPNTRTVMQVKVAAATPAPAFDLNRLNQAFKHKADGSGVFESGQHPIIVGQAAYNSAYGTNFVSAGSCNGGSTSSACDGFARINDQGGMMFGFNTLMHPDQKLEIPLEPKAIHDEMNAAAFDEFGRMTANIGLEAVPATPALQNIILYPYVNPPTEIINATNLPKNDLANLGIHMSPIATADGTQIWKITHNGVDTHPLHWHLYDVQLLNRVTWDNIIIPPDASELGWKDTVRVSPLEDTYVALRPVIPALPFELPNSIRPMHPMTPIGSPIGFNNVDTAGNPTNPLLNQLINFGWEYVWHCHILSHEEMDMMRPVAVATQPIAPDGLTYRLNGNGRRVILTWNDNSINETAFVVQRNDGSGWVDAGTVSSPLELINTHGSVSFVDPLLYNSGNAYMYQVVAQNTVGLGGEFMSTTAQSVSAPVVVGSPPADPANLRATLLAGPEIRLVWQDNALNETGFIIQRSDNGGDFVQIATVSARNNTGNVRYNDATVTPGNSYTYQVAATNVAGTTAFINSPSIAVPLPIPPGAPAIANATAAPLGNIYERVTVTWNDVTGETGYIIQWSSDNFATVAGSTQWAANAVSGQSLRIARQNWQFRVGAVNLFGTTWSNVVNVAAP